MVLEHNARHDCNISYNCAQAAVPPDFDAEAYLTWHPSLREDGINTTVAAKAHYARHGRAAGLIYRPYRVLYSFNPAQGPTSAVQGNTHLVRRIKLNLTASLPKLTAGRHMT